MAGSMRNGILNLHLWAALAAGLILIVVAVSGCLLVFELQMDRWLDPEVSYVSPQDAPATYTAMLDLRALLVERGLARPYWEGT